MPKINSYTHKQIGLDDFFKFGKHKGEQVEDVIEDDPSWIAWACENEVCEFDDEVLEKLTRKGIV